MNDEVYELVDKAVEGDKAALEKLLVSVQNTIYNLSLRMLGNLSDAEDATQEIMIKIMTKLSSFRKESSFSTWVYSIATNYLINYKKGMFANQLLSFEFYAEDFNAPYIPVTDEITKGVDSNLLAEELKQSCTNVMLQCLDADSRCIYVLGQMFRADSKVCGEILGMTADAFRQKLSRIRKKVNEFMSEYCGLTATGKCHCKERLGYAIQTHRLNPTNLEYSKLEHISKKELDNFTNAMEEMDGLSDTFSQLPKYKSNFDSHEFLTRLLQSNTMDVIRMEV